MSENVTLEINLLQSEETTIMMTDLQGKLVAVLFRGNLESGNQKLHLNIQNLKSGIYFLRVQTGAQHLVRKVIVT